MRGQTRNYYDQVNYQNRYRWNSGDRRMSFRVELNMDRIIEEGCNMLTIIEVTLGEEILVECKIIEVNVLEMDIELTIETNGFKRGRSRSRERYIQVTLEGMIESRSTRSRSSSRASANRDRKRCFKCREYLDQVQEPILIET